MWVYSSFLSFLLIFSGISTASAQNFTYTATEITITEKATVNISSIREDWMPALQNIEMPNPTGFSHRSELMRLKEASREYHKGKRSVLQPPVEMDGTDPIIIMGFEGNEYSNSVPNDNDIAISNSGSVVSVINTNILMVDTNTDSVLAYLSLHAFADTLNLTGSKFDPKTLYDPVEDRFIIVFLNGSLDSTSRIVVAFSKTNDPSGQWNLYALPGNPVDNGTWSDYPIVGISKEELFISVNTFTNGSANNSGFTESTFWQVRKDNGYAGEALETKYHHGLKLNGVSFFNITPIQGGSEPTGPHMYLVSNRNLDLENDSIFLFKVHNTIANGGTLTVDVIKAPAYGLPPEARQPNSHRFDTNDSRILGGYVEEDNIQFVGSTIIPETGFAGIYHGFIEDASNKRTATVNMIGDPLLDLGFPNISYSGITEGDKESIITAVYSSADTFPGFAAIYFGNDGKYSKVNILKKGTSYVNIVSGTYERWGDYSGTQRKYNEPGVVWASGSYGYFRSVPFPDKKNINATWIAALKSPDSVRIPPPAEFPQAIAFPNPTRDMVSIYFTISEENSLEMLVFDINGRLVKKLLQEKAKKGENMFSFSAAPLPAGTYFLVIRKGDEIIIREKFIKQ